MRTRILFFTLVLVLFAGCSTDKVDIITVHKIAEPPSDMADNPFLTESNLPFGAPDFDDIRDEDYLPAFEEAMNQQLQEIDALISENGEPAFESIIVGLEKTGQMLTRVQQVFFNMTSAHTNEHLQRLQSELAPRLAAHSDNILLNADLFSKVQELYENRDSMNLDEESARLLEDTYLNFVRAGANLDEEDQARIREINEEISSLTTQFQEALLEMSKERAVLVEDADLLEGLGRGRIEAAREAAEERGHPNHYLLSITNTTRQPVLRSLNNRELRQRVWEASAGRGIGQQGGVDTRPLILDIVTLRTEKAELLGYQNWAEYKLERQTAGEPDTALEMLVNLIPDVLENVREEASEIAALMEQEGIEGELEPWDWEYYAEKVRQEQYDLNEDEVRSYFELNTVLENGVFFTMERLFGIRFEERTDLPVYHPDVRVFDVLEEDGTPIGLFYGDYYQRDSKRGGAWMSSFVRQSRLLEQKPVIVNVLNIPKPAAGEPTLLTFDEVVTLFHEMGHAVHGLFSDVNYPSLSGTSVPRDFVEFPSTFEEDWAIQTEVLENYAIHHETGETLPEDLLERLIEARTFNQGYDTLEYLAAALVDMEWHILDSGYIPENVEVFETLSLEKYQVDTNPVPPRYKSPFFAHIFAGGYSANYYAYIWSEVLAADAFAYMQSRGGLTRENGEHFRETILSRGGVRESMDLYLDFRGEMPDERHLLIRRDLLSEESEEEE